MKFSDFIIPVVIAFVLVYGLIKGVNVFDEFLAGAKDGITTSVKILPALVALMTCVGMFKASGALDIITFGLKPLGDLIGMPREVMPLAILRPISGSGSLVILKDILSTHGPDSLIGRIASVMQGSTETTFYTIAVYFGAVNVSKTRHTLACSISSDIIAFILSSVVIYILF